MVATIIDGRAMAATVRAELKAEIATRHVPPGLAFILVGDHPASQIYVKNKTKACADIGIRSHAYRLSADASASELNTLIDTLNDNPEVHGILLQQPLPSHLDSGSFLERISPHKDVDGLHPANLGLLMAGHPRFIPCTPQGVMMLIESVASNIAGANAVVIGRSVLVGKPMAQLLLAANATVTQAHIQTKDLASHTRMADIIVTATGVPGLITAAHVKPGAIVIDVGITRVGEQIIGDVDFATVSQIARAITPVPGGVGPMTIACLLKNTVRAAGDLRLGT